MLKKVYLNWIKKQEHIYFMTGHVKRGISDRFKGKLILLTK